MLSRLFPARVEERAPVGQASMWGVWPGDPVDARQVTPSSAMQLLAVAGCVRLISDSISTLPVDVFRTLSDGSREELPPPLWIREPTIDLDFPSWCSQVVTSLLLHGNAYIAVTRNGSAIVELVPVNPELVTVRRNGARKEYWVGGRVYPGEILHLKGMMLPGSDVGLSPLEYARQSISLGISAQEFGADQFDGALNMPGVIEYPGTVDPKTAQAIAQWWRRARRKANRGAPGVIEGGGTWKPTGVTNEQAQFLQTRQWTAAEIAAQVFMVDPRELGIPITGTSLEYSNSESRNADFLRKTLLPWIIRLEQALSSLLASPRFVKFNVNGLLRADSSARWAQYATAMTINTQAAQVGMGAVLTTDEIRRFEDLGPAPEMDVPTAAPPPVPADVEDDVDDEDEDMADEPRSAAVVVEPARVPDFHMHLPESTRVELSTGELADQSRQMADTSARVADMAEQVADTLEGLPEVIAEAVRTAVVAAIPEQKPVTKTVRRDEHGRIVEVTERPDNG